MNIIDKLFRKLGYARIQKHIPTKEEKFRLELMKMEYEIDPRIYIGAPNPSMYIAIEHEVKVSKFLQTLAPFVERRMYQQYPLRANQQDEQRYELRIYVAKPPVNS